MKKYIITALAFACAMLAQADDSYLYWMLDSAPHGSMSEYYVSVKAGDSYLTFGNSEFDAAELVTGSRYQMSLANIANSENASYIFEIWNDQGAEPAFVSNNSYTYKALEPYISNGSEHFSDMHLSAADFHAVPEPTSGLMLLIGAALLGLKRKKIA